MAPIARVEDLRPGDLGFGPIHGLAGLGAGIGQWIMGQGWTLDTDHEIKIRHVTVITSRAVSAPDGTLVAYPEHVEAMPSGARRIRAHRWDREWAYARIPEDYPGQGEDAAAVALAMVGISYSPLSYPALGAWAVGLSTPHLERWINRRSSATRIKTPPASRPFAARLPREMICSVLADQAWTLAGKSVMHDVPHQCVTPKALANTLRWGTPGALWAFPGR